MKYSYPKYKLKQDFTPGTWSENDWKLGEAACVDRAFYYLPDGTEFAFFKCVERTRTGRKKVRWEEWRDGKFSNNYFNTSFDDACRWMENYINFNGFKSGRQNYRVYE